MVTEAESAPAVAGVLKKGPWAAAEDAMLMEYVRKHGEGNWNAVQRNTGLQRCGKSCRLRWANHLRPNLKKGAFSPDEEHLIIDLHSKLGNKWARISSQLPGRTDNDIKNYWNTRVKRRLRQGLPLYTNQNNSIQSQPFKTSSFETLTLAFSLQKNAPNNNTLSLFNSVPLSSPMFTFHHPPFFPSHSLKRCSNSYLGQLPPSPSLMDSFHMGSVGIGFDLDQVPPTRNITEGFGFDFPNSFELPSNQLNQNVASDPVVVDEVKTSNNSNNNNLNVGRTKSGLLDDLLQEAQFKVGGGRGLKRERDQDCDFHWNISTSQNSSNGTWGGYMGGQAGI